MTHLDHTSHARHAAAGPRRHARIRLVSDAVMASYIHDISSRAPRWQAPAEAPQPVAQENVVCQPRLSSARPQRPMISSAISTAC